jgi:hypothetical protein
MIARRFVLLGWIAAAPMLFGCGYPSDVSVPTGSPVVTGVFPSQAAPGSLVTIAGSNFGPCCFAQVTMGGHTAFKSRMDDSEIVVQVPTAPPGDAPVVVTYSGRSSAPFAFRILAGP